MQHTRLRLHAYNGPITINALADATTVTVTGERRVGSESMHDAEMYLDSLAMIQARGRPMAVSLATSGPFTINARYHVRYPDRRELQG